ncbi:MAG: CHASE4 domain-containing protein [Pseudobdellovibrionaceae bacterium]
MIPLFWLVGNYVVGHQFKSLERERTETAADRLQELSSSEVQVLTELSLQYSVWDDSYNYVMKQIRNYEAASYQQDVIFDGRLSGAYIFNKNRQFLFCQKYLYAEKQYIPCAEKGKDAQKIQQILETHFQKINN